jgi:addiction module HigA family antidote
MRMANPPHPGGVIKRLYLDPLGLTVTEAAEGLGVNRNTFSKLINGHNGISPEMAHRLSKAFGHSPESWLEMQLIYDLAQVQDEAEKLEVKSFYQPEMQPA